MQNVWRLFSSRGRLNRARYWLCQIPIWASFLAIMAGQSSHQRGTDISLLLAALLMLELPFAVVALWISVATSIQRLHDRGLPGAWLLVQFVPVIGPLFLFVQCYCLPGTKGANKYGPDPLSPFSDVANVFEGA